MASRNEPGGRFFVVFDCFRTIAGGSPLLSGSLLRSVEGPVETWAWADDMSNGPPSTTGGAGGQSVAGCKDRVRGQRGGDCFVRTCKIDFLTPIVSDSPPL